MNRAGRVLRLGCAWLFAATLTSCFGASDDANVIVDLYWDRLSDAASFRGSSCATAGVDRMAWRLIRRSDGVQVAEGEDTCCPASGPCDAHIDSMVIAHPAPGDYTLEVEGFDATSQQLWGVQCQDLHATRFESAYRCDVPSPPE